MRWTGRKSRRPRRIGADPMMGGGGVGSGDDSLARKETMATVEHGSATGAIEGEYCCIVEGDKTLD